MLNSTDGSEITPTLKFSNGGNAYLLREIIAK
jgi:hypothetical protein